LRDADGQEERNLILKSEKLTNQISECDTTAEAARGRTVEIEKQLRAAKEQGMAAQAAFRVRTSLTNISVIYTGSIHVQLMMVVCSAANVAVNRAGVILLLLVL
jgi:hypothetical protein